MLRVAPRGYRALKASGGASHFLKGIDGSFTGPPVGGSYRRLWWQALKDLSTVLIDLGRAVSKKRLLLRGTEHQKWMLLTPEDRHMATATFGAGCFWGVEAAFRRIEGVTDAAVGYAGGRTDNPTYRDVCSHGTGHAEVVQVEYDPARVSYETLLEAFWEMHDPTQVNRQGPDVGDQYRSVIFFHTPEQEQKATQSKQGLETGHLLKRPIATLIQPAPTFWRAEEYHQRYLEKNSGAACSLGHAGGGR